MASKIQNIECICQFISVIKDFKSSLITLIDALIGSLTALKAYLILFNVDLEDELRKLQYNAEIKIYEEAIQKYCSILR
jgi:hypothetical protein